MFSKLNYKKKNVLIYLAMLAGLYLAWFCSYKGTITSMLLNRELKRSQPAVGEHTSILPIVLKKQVFYNNVVKSYHVNAPDKEGYIWQALSGIAIHYDADIIMEPLKTTENDSLSYVEVFQFSFKGTYQQMEKVLDSVNNTNGIGRCSAFTLSREQRSSEDSRKLNLKLQLSISK